VTIKRWDNPSDDVQKMQLAYWRCGIHNVQVPQGEDCPGCERDRRERDENQNKNHVT